MIILTQRENQKKMKKENGKLPFHGVHGRENILICREGDKEGERNQPETYCEIRHHLKVGMQFVIYTGFLLKLARHKYVCSQNTHLTEWIIILAKV